VAVLISITVAGAAIRGSCGAVCAICGPSGSRLRAGLHFNLVVLAFPAVLFRPEEREPQAAFTYWQGNVHVMDFHRGIRGAAVVRVMPFVRRPVQQERRVGLDAENRTGRHSGHLAAGLPDLDVRAFAAAADVAVVSRFDQIEDPAVGRGALQLDVLGVRPQQRLG